MRVNIYAEEMTDRVELVEKDGFIGVRFYLYLPVSGAVVGSYPRPDSTEQVKNDNAPMSLGAQQVRGPFIHRPGDDDSAAVTFWGKRDLATVLQKALTLLESHS